MRERSFSAVPRRRRRLFASFAVAAALVPLAVALAYAGDLKGRVTGAENLRPSVYASIAAEGRHAFTVRDFDPLVPTKYSALSADVEKDVTLAIYGAGDKSAFGLGQLVRLAGARAVPATVVIPTGVPVLLRNDDPFTHHIVGPEIDRDLKPGEVHKFEPKTKGVVTVTDTLTPSVKLWVVVEDGVIADRWAARDGSLKITDMAAAEYNVKAFFEGKEKASATFKVPASGSVELKEPLAVAPASSAAPAASASSK